MGNTVATHSSRRPQAPTMEVTMGMTELPNPRSTPTRVSMMPQMK